MSGSSKCPHSDVHFNINHAQFGDSNINYMEITGHCKVCDKPLVFRGAPLGVSPNHPTMALGGNEIRLPFLVEGEELEGNAIGFAVRAIA